MHDKEDTVLFLRFRLDRLESACLKSGSLAKGSCLISGHKKHSGAIINIKRSDVKLFASTRVLGDVLASESPDGKDVRNGALMNAAGMAAGTPNGRVPVENFRYPPLAFRDRSEDLLCGGLCRASNHNVPQSRFPARGSHE